MAGRKRPTGTDKRSPSVDNINTVSGFRQHLDRGIEDAAKKGEWERWLHLAQETGDPQFWPQIRKFYQEQPDWRWMILFHLRVYWLDYEQMVAPVFREALLDPDQCEEAAEAVEEFPSLAEDVVVALQDPECLWRICLGALSQALACLKQYPEQAVDLLRKALQDPRYYRDVDCASSMFHLAAAFPPLADDVVGIFKNPELVRCVGPDPILGCLACLFGLTEGPADQIHTEWGWQDSLLDGVRAELQRRYSLDLDRLVSVDQPDGNT